MDMDIPATASCTTCEFADDFSNYWTAVLYFRARNGTFKRVPQMPNQGFESADGGMTVYYTPSYNGGKVTAFQPVRLSLSHHSWNVWVTTKEPHILTWTPFS